MTSSPRSPRLLLAALALVAAAGPALAENRVKVTAARVGLPSGSRATDRDDDQAGHVSKFAAWAPVYVEIQLLGKVTEPAELVVEAPDADEVTATFAVPVTLTGDAGTVLSPAQLGRLPYLKPSGGSGEITVYVRTTAGEAISEPYRIKYYRPREPLTYVVLSLNGKLPGFDLPRPATAGPQDNTALLRGGRVELAAISDVGLLPDQWFGYSGADLVVLTTGSAGTDEFLGRLFGDRGSPADKARRAALLEWVRRGGRLVISAGANAGQLTALAANPEFHKLLPAAVNPKAPTRSVNDLPLAWAAREAGGASVLSGVMSVRNGTVTAANLLRKTDRPGRVVIPPPARQSDRFEPIAVQSTYGLGRVTLIGFDLDRPPFTDFASRAEVWDWVLREGGANRASIGQEGKHPTGAADEEDELAVALRTHTDTFDGVPVVSFGWVAMLIVLYILLIGPVEYFFLKRVLKRLELTWVTFPVIVVTVSVAAYLTAYAVKGRDLKVNKVDVVEVDPASGRVYGTTWFTVFSPRIDSYTAGVTPAPDLAPHEAGGTVVGWVGGPRAGRAGLLRRKYQFKLEPQSETGADRLDDVEMAGVPIQVWSTKSFTANWSAPLDPANPVVESRLVHPPGDPTAVVGTFVNRLPFPELTECVAFYAGKAYPLGILLPDTEVRLMLEGGREAGQWLQDESQLATVLGRAAGGAGGGGSRGGATTATRPTAGNALPLLGLLFHETALRNDEGVYPRNASLRRLDQSWRLSPQNRDEVIIVGRSVLSEGPAEEALGGAASPTRLWLKGLPGEGHERTPVPGTGRQETYVRVYLPVRTVGAGR